MALFQFLLSVRIIHFRWVFPRTVTTLHKMKQNMQFISGLFTDVFVREITLLSYTLLSYYVITLCLHKNELAVWSVNKRLHIEHAELLYKDMPFSVKNAVCILCVAVLDKSNLNWQSDARHSSVAADWRVWWNTAVWQQRVDWDQNGW